MGWKDELRSGKISGAFNAWGDILGNGPDQNRAAAAKRHQAEADQQALRDKSARISALGDEIGRGGYDQGVQGNYYTSQTAGLDKGYYDASRSSAAAMARSGLGDSALNSSLQMQGTQDLSNARASAMRASIAQATADRRNALQGQIGALQGSANIDSNLYNADAENAAALDARRNAFGNMLTQAIPGLAGAGIGAMVGGPVGAAAGMKLGSSLGGGGGSGVAGEDAPYGAGAKYNPRMNSYRPDMQGGF